MQDREALDSHKVWPVAWLFMDAATDNTEKENRDLFVKRRGFRGLCPGCGAAALFTLQTFASSGGQGHYSSLRRTGPLTTLVVHGDLWHTVWANVLNRRQLIAHEGRSSAIRFPWMNSKSRKSRGNEVLPTQVHPVYRFWGMPRRIWLLFEEAQSVCDLCGKETERTVREYAIRRDGNRYQGPWRHPLTPYRVWNDGMPSPIAGTVDGARYRNWLGLTLGDETNKLKTEPAQVVRAFASRCKDIDPEHAEFLVRAYGYDMDNMKARGFCFGEMPAWSFSKPGLRDAFAYEVQRLILAADYVAAELKRAVFEALVHEKRGGRQRKSLIGRTLFKTTVARFWSGTEPAFYDRLPELHRAVQERRDTLPIRESWRTEIASKAMRLFAEATDASRLDGGDIKRVARAQRALRSAVGPWSRKMQAILDLPAPPQTRDEAAAGAFA